MAATDGAIGKRTRFFFLTVLVLGVYPLLTSCIIQHGGWYIKRAWIFLRGWLADSEYTTAFYEFRITYFTIVFYDLGIYLVFIHLPFVGIVSWYGLAKKKWACYGVYLFLFLVVDLVLFPEPTMSSFFGRHRVGESYTLVIIVATCMFPLYYWILKRPVEPKQHQVATQ